MDEEKRLNIQYEIIQFLARQYDGMCIDDYDEAYEQARTDSYKIMKIIMDNLNA